MAPMALSSGVKTGVARAAAAAGWMRGLTGSSVDAGRDWELRVDGDEGSGYWREERRAGDFKTLLLFRPICSSAYSVSLQQAYWIS